MLDLLGMIGSLNRPRLLVSAARFGVDDYSRTAHLPRLLKVAAPPRTGEAILQLLRIEAGLEAKRVACAADYAVARHVAVLVALMGEARLLRATHRAVLAKLPTAVVASASVANTSEFFSLAA